MNQLRKIKQFLDKKRRGSALMLTLGMLSLVMIIAMVFAFDARSTRKAADNHSVAIRAQLINDSGIKRAMGVLTTLFKEDNIIPNPAKVFFPGPVMTDWEGGRYLPSLTLNTISNDGIDSAFSSILQLQGTDTMQYTPASGLPAFANSASWDSVVVDGSIVGDFAYLIVDNTGMLDPGAVGGTSVTRVGESLREVPIGVAFTGSAGDRTSYSMDTCYSLSDFCLTGVPVSIKTDELKLKKSLSCGTSPEPEEFWVNANADNVAENSELFKRMDITQVGVTIDAEHVYSFLLTGDSEASVTASTDSSKSLWLSKSGLAPLNLLPDSPEAVAKMAETARHYAAKLALSMVDYADADKQASIVTMRASDGMLTMEDPSTYIPRSHKGGSSAIIYGTENVGLYELAVTMDCAAPTATVNDSGEDDSSVSVDFKIEIRLHNPMGTPFVPTAKIAFTCKLEDENNESDEYIMDPISPQPMTFIQTPTDCTGTYEHTEIFRLTTSTYTCIEFKINRLEFKDNGEVVRNYPVCAEGESSNDYFCNWTWGDETANNSAKDMAFHIKSKDPMFADLDASSTRAAEVWEVVDSIGDLGTGYMTAGSTPTVGNAALVDYETGCHYCDAKCANSPFTRVAELGRVHSPHTAHRSVRFWVYDPTAVNMGVSVGDWQDAYLLDMFKAGPKTEARKINPNMINPGVIKAVFHGVTPSDIAGSNTHRDAISASLPSANGMMVMGAPEKPFVHRGEIYKAFLNNHSGGIVTNASREDDAEEGLIEKTVELLSPRYNYYTIIVASRALKDMGGNDHTAFDDKCVQVGTGKFAKVEAIHKRMFFVRRDSWKQTCKIINVTALED